MNNVVDFPIRGQKEKTQKVFIYGTLKQGHYFHEQYLGGQKSLFLGKARASDAFTLFIDALPNLVRESNTGELVKGELYAVDEDVLKSLDDLEGHPTIYRREVIDIQDDQGKPQTVWAYIRPAHFKGRAFASKETEFV